jgi:hypothetical protein
MVLGMLQNNASGRKTQYASTASNSLIADSFRQFWIHISSGGFYLHHARVLTHSFARSFSASDASSKMPAKQLDHRHLSNFLLRGITKVARQQVPSHIHLSGYLPFYILLLVVQLTRAIHVLIVSRTTRSWNKCTTWPGIFGPSFWAWILSEFGQVLRFGEGFSPSELITLINLRINHLFFHICFLCCYLPIATATRVVVELSDHRVCDTITALDSNPKKNVFFQEASLVGFLI